eukprot:m.278107 g.278107  ORF g.278107 m.278107 type:complete len:455 (-) comp15736_c1_seq5:2303-3667(-)
MAGHHQGGPCRPPLFCTYMLTGVQPRTQKRTYIGFTTNPVRRLRQHNGELVGGARRTKRAKGAWDMVLCVHGFPSQVAALRFEWAWQHPDISKRLKQHSALSRTQLLGREVAHKLAVLKAMLTTTPWSRLPLNLHWFIPRYREACPSFALSEPATSTAHGDHQHVALPRPAWLPPHMSETCGPLGGEVFRLETGLEQSETLQLTHSHLSTPVAAANPAVGDEYGALDSDLDSDDECEREVQMHLPSDVRDIGDDTDTDTDTDTDHGGTSQDGAHVQAAHQTETSYGSCLEDVALDDGEDSDELELFRTQSMRLPLNCTVTEDPSQQRAMPSSDTDTAPASLVYTTARPHKAWTCRICERIEEDELPLHCPAADCMAFAHMTCLAGTLLAQLNDNAALVPTHGNCFACGRSMVWGTLVSTYKIECQAQAGTLFATDELPSQVTPSKSAVLFKSFE